MRRIVWLILLTTALSSPASARAYSFVVRGHRVHVPPHCRSLSCISVSGIGNLRRGHHDDDVATVNDPLPARAAPPAPAPAIAPPPAQPVYAPPIAQAAPPAPAPLPPVARAQTIPPVPAPALAAAPPSPAPSVGFEAPRPQQSPTVQLRDPVRPAPQNKPVVEQPAPPVARVAQADEDDDSPIGDWQTEGRNGLVRIESCGESLCGYVLNATTKAKGETVLVNMKATKASQWAGNIYSRSSGNSYYGTMTLREGNSLRVEACALGSYFCSGNTWTRFEDSRSVHPADVANTRQNTPSPRS